MMKYCLKFFFNLQQDGTDYFGHTCKCTEYDLRYCDYQFDVSLPYHRQCHRNWYLFTLLAISELDGFQAVDVKCTSVYKVYINMYVCHHENINTLSCQNEIYC